MRLSFSVVISISALFALGACRNTTEFTGSLCSASDSALASQLAGTYTVLLPGAVEVLSLHSISDDQLVIVQKPARNMDQPAVVVNSHEVAEAQKNKSNVLRICRIAGVKNPVAEYSSSVTDESGVRTMTFGYYTLGGYEDFALSAKQRADESKTQLRLPVKSEGFLAFGSLELVSGGYSSLKDLGLQLRSFDAQDLKNADGSVFQFKSAVDSLTVVSKEAQKDTNAIVQFLGVKNYHYALKCRNGQTLRDCAFPK